jgi:hypothetical protein
MKKIVTFDEFSRINESEDPYMDSKIIKLIRDLGNLTTKRLANTLISSPSFGGFILKHLSNNQYEVFYKWKGKENSLGIIYDPTKGGDPQQYGLKFSFTPEGIPNDVPQNELRWVFRDHVWKMMDSLIKEDRDSAKDFNPFDSGLESLPILKDLEKHGAQIVSTPIERKNGTVALKFGNSGIVYTIQKSGYIRRKGASGYLTDHPDLIYPITNIEGLVPKIVYVFNTHLKDRASMEGIPPEEINDLIKELNTEDGASSDSYKDKFEKMISKHPGISVYLPSPENWEDNGIKQGARILGRLGIF